MSNIRQLNSSFSMYVSDNAAFPYGVDSSLLTFPPGGSVGNLAFDISGWWWFNYLKDVYKKNMSSKTVLQCPSRQMQQSKLKTDILAGNYGVNLSICRMSTGNPDQNEFVGKPRCFSEISRPAQTLLIVDSGYAIIGWHHATDVPPVTLDSSRIENTAYIPGLSINRQRQLWPEQIIDAVYGRHPQLTVNVGFADGHVARTKAEDLLVKKTADGHYQNQYPLWTPNSK
jgi:prepilin-type processing-associated H-X9-DG protein